MRSGRERAVGTGFSLVELLVALALLGLIVFMAMPLLVGSMERIMYGRQASQDIYQLQQQLELSIATGNPASAATAVVLRNGTVIMEPVVDVYQDDVGSLRYFRLAP